MAGTYVSMTVADSITNKTNTYRDLAPSPKPRSGGVSSGDSSKTSFQTDRFGSHSGDEEDHRFHVRRPIRGISIKPNTHAFIQVIRKDNNKVLSVFNNLGASGLQPGQKYPIAADVVADAAASPYIDAEPLEAADVANPLNDSWTDWLLQSVTESRTEKTQITETFSDPVLYVYGERPRFIKFVGYLMNTADFNWRAAFWHNWDLYFRASKLIELNAEVHIGFDDVIVTGYPMNAIAQQSANNPHIVNFQFTMYITRYMNLYMNNVGSIQNQMLESRDNQRTRREFIVSGDFNDFTSDAVREKFEQSLMHQIGGDRLRFVNFMKDTFGFMGGGGDGASRLAIDGGVLGFSMNDLLLNPSLAYIKGGKTAVEFLVTQSRRVASHYAFLAADALADAHPAGASGLNFWFGLVGHLYQMLTINAVSGLGGRTTSNRWIDLVDNIAQVGNIYRLASYMGYAAAAATSQLYRATNKFENSGIETDYSGRSARFWKSTGQNTDIGVKIHHRTPFQSSRNSALLNSVVPQGNTVSNAISFSAQDDQNASFGTPKPEVDNLLESEPTPGGELDDDTIIEQRAQEGAAVDAQESERQENHGALEVIETDGDLEDDGGD